MSIDDYPDSPCSEYEVVNTKDSIILVDPNRRKKFNYCSKTCERVQKFWGIKYFFPERNYTTNGELTPALDMKLKQRCILITFMIVSVLVLFVLLGISVGLSPASSHLSHQLGITINVEELTERSKCPACFGVNLCPDIVSGKVELNDWNKFKLSKLVNSKNVFYATWDGRGGEKQIVLKKLAHDHELDKLDRAICDRHGKDESCQASDSIVPLIAQYSHTPGDDEPIILHGEKIGKGSDILLCPSHRKMDFLIQAATKFSKGLHRTTVLANVLTTLLINPEPLLLQAFPAKDGWPFPKYYGACGRVIAEEYVGRRLTLFYDEPFLIRAQIAKQLLEMGNKFSENPSNFILYLTDISPDNFAVDETTNQVKIVDLENIIMVDKEIVIRSKVKDANQLHVSESVLCDPNENAEKMCFGFSPNDLCQRPVSDHNYYAICSGLLAPAALSDQFPDGLLHSLPEDFKTDPKLSNFAEILQKCNDPKSSSQSSHHLTRIEAAQTLIKLLGDYLKTRSSK